MAEYIKREDAINAVESLPTWWADEGGYYGGMQQPRVALLEPEDVINAIKNIPSADVVEVKHGEWVDGGVDGVGACDIEYRYNKCSVCGYEYSFPMKYNFCPNCGADMRTDGGT